jgi:hypothetical protein
MQPGGILRGGVEMARKYYQTFVVVPAFEFPLDMLRYDSCFPESEQESGKIFDNLAYNVTGQEIKIARYVDGKKYMPTIERWESFNCKVSNIEVR